ncbi:MAG: biotin/lipoyl-binding protein, partial [Muribaculaceae bacterium]|nr:biotin/lipoyl-binding protein [Muribaculaceae bacterium]
EEKPYDTASYKMPDNPTLDDLGGVKLASNNEEYLLLQLLPTVANGFLRKRRQEEYDAKKAAEAPAEAKVEVTEEVDNAPITGPTIKAPMGGRVISVSVKKGDAVKKGQILLVYEAMKMENDVTAEKDGVVKRVFVKPDEVVGTDAVLVEFE